MGQVGSLWVGCGESVVRRAGCYSLPGLVNNAKCQVVIINVLSVGHGTAHALPSGRSSWRPVSQLGSTEGWLATRAEWSAPSLPGGGAPRQEGLSQAWEGLGAWARPPSVCLCLGSISLSQLPKRQARPTRPQPAQPHHQPSVTRSVVTGIRKQPYSPRAGSLTRQGREGEGEGGLGSWAGGKGEAGSQSRGGRQARQGRVRQTPTPTLSTT